MMRQTRICDFMTEHENQTIRTAAKDAIDEELDEKAFSEYINTDAGSACSEVV